MRPPIRIRSARARAFFAALENVKSDAQTRSRSACAEMVATVFLSRGDRCPGSRTAKLGRQRSARASMHRAGAARLRAAIAPHRESRPRAKARWRVHLSVSRFHRESLYHQLDPAPLG